MQATSRVFLAWLFLVLAGCGSASRVYEYNFLALGTLVKISVYTDDEDSAARAARLVESDLGRLHDNYYPTRGELGALNLALRKGGTGTADADLQVLLIRGRELELESNGLFNPAMGELFQLWGFVSDERSAGVPPPDPDAIAAIVDREQSMQMLSLDRGVVTSSTPLVLDLGAYAKGYALEVAARRFEEAGLENVLINAGGDIAALGQPGDRLWRVGIRKPDGVAVLAGVEMQPGETVVTSGDYERFFEHEGKRFHHILDPRTGYPAGKTRSVTVIDTDAVLADAVATALFVAGPDLWAEVASDMGVGYVMLVDEENRIHMTSNMAERMQLIGEHDVTVTDLP